MRPSMPATVDLEPLSRFERTLFQLSNAVVVPVWAGMVLVPQSRITRRLVQTTPPLLVGLSAAYAALLARAIARRGAPPNYFDAEEVRQLLVSRDAINAAWIHYVAFDLFVGRAIWEQATRDGRTARTETLLAFVAGPVGWLVSEARRRRRS